MLAARLNREEGFTLVELMIVVLIMAILMGLGIASFLMTRAQARSRHSQTALNTALKAQRAYATENPFSYTTDGAEMESIEPSLNYDGATNDSCTGYADPTCVAITVLSPTEVLLVARDGEGMFWALRDKVSPPDHGTYYNNGGDLVPPNASDVTDDRW